MAELTREIRELEERELNLRSTDFFRPALKQIGNSIYEIKTHYMSQEKVNSIPRYCTSQLAEIRDTFVRHLEEEDCFLHKTSIVTGDPVESGHERRQQCASVLVVLMDSLALAMDFEVSHRPNDVVCDLFLAICGQPVMVLTIVDGGTKDNRTVRKYNTSVARGVTMTLRKFMDEHINIVFGVLSVTDLIDMKCLRTCLETVVKNSSFVTRSTLTTNQLTYEKILTSFWAGVAETRSVISSDGGSDSDYLRFLTKDQCVILMENINRREVEVPFQTGTGATTLMVEVARRLSNLDDTLLVCGSHEEKERLKSVYPNTIAMTEMERVDLSKYTNIVGEIQVACGHVRGKRWNFTKVYSDNEQRQLQHEVKMFENETANIEKMILIMSSADRQNKMSHLIQETEILKLLDASVQGLFGAYDLATRTALDVLLVKQDSSGNRSRNQTWQTVDILDRLKQDITQRRNVFPTLAEVLRQMKYSISYLQVKVDYLNQATVSSANRLKYEDPKNQTAYSTNKDVELGNLMGQTNKEECESGELPNTQQTETQSIQAKRPNVIAQEGASDGLNTEQIWELRMKLDTLKMMAERKKQELNTISEDYGVEWEYNMECLSQNMDNLKIRDVIMDVIGENEIPETTYKLQEPFTFDCNSSSRRRGVSRCQVHQLRKLQFGRLGHSDLLAIVGNLVTDDQSRLNHLRTLSDHLEREYGSPVHIVGELEAKKSGPVSCPHMELDQDRVHGSLSVSESGELTNVEESGRDQHVRSRGDQRVRSRGDQRVEKFQRFWGTCSRLPLPPSPSTLSVPRYWESKSRLRVKEDVSGLPLLELGVTRKEKMDSILRLQSGTWSVMAGCCDVHEDTCTRVYGERRLCGGCHRNNLSLTPGTGVQTIHWGVVVDMGRGRVGFVDVTRGRVLHRFDVNITDYLRPMFGMMPWPDHYEIHTRLLSGAEISMDENKQSLIAKALFGPIAH